MWYIDPLLGIDHKIKKYATAVTGQRLVNRSIGIVFFMCFMPRWYKQDTLGVSE
jgi:hypothetical protein